MTSLVLQPEPPQRGTGHAARLFEEYSEQILGYCLRQLRSRTEAEDAVQTTFLYALRALRRGVVPECESAWLTTIARNVCHSQRRALDRRGPLASGLDLDTIALGRPDGDEEELLMGLKDALASIPESQRRALVLREWQGLPTREIASRLGMTPPATQALLTRARHSLAQALTAATRRPALSINFGALFFQLRSHVKALFGGSAAAKAVATTAVVAGVAIGGVSVERALAGDRGAPQAPPPGSVQADVAEAPRGGVTSVPAVGLARTRVPRTRVESGSSSSPAGAATSDSIEVPSSPTEGVVSSRRQEAIGEETTSDLVPLLGLLHEPLPESLPLPPLDLPTDELPTDLIPPAPELPPTTSVPMPSANDLQAPPPPPDLGLPSVLP